MAKLPVREDEKQKRTRAVERLLALGVNRRLLLGILAELNRLAPSKDVPEVIGGFRAPEGWLARLHGGYAKTVNAEVCGPGLGVIARQVAEVIAELEKQTARWRQASPSRAGQGFEVRPQAIYAHGVKLTDLASGFRRLGEQLDRQLLRKRGKQHTAKGELLRMLCLRVRSDLTPPGAAKLGRQRWHLIADAAGIAVRELEDAWAARPNGRKKGD